MQPVCHLTYRLLDFYPQRAYLGGRFFLIGDFPDDLPGAGFAGVCLVVVCLAVVGLAGGCFTGVGLADVCLVDVCLAGVGLVEGGLTDVCLTGVFFSPRTGLDDVFASGILSKANWVAVVCFPVFCFSTVPLVFACLTVVGLAAARGAAADLVLPAGLGGFLVLADAVCLAGFLRPVSFLGGAATWLAGF